MRAIVISEYGGPEVLQWREVPYPQPQAGEVRIAVKATGVNRLDLLQRKGLYPVPPGYSKDIPGVEFAGVVESVGTDVVNFHVGDRVFGLHGGGTYAEYVVSDELMVMPIPDGMSFVDAAAVPEAFITAYDAMIWKGGVTAGQAVLVSAAGSGVGIAAIQICKALGMQVIGTARTAAKLEAATKYGLQHAIEVSGEPNFSEKVLEITSGTGVDFILELVGGPYVAEDIKCCAKQGRIMLVGLLAGAQATIDLASVLRKSLHIEGTTLRSRPPEQKIDITEKFTRDVLPLLADGTVVPVVDRVFPIEQAPAAHEYVARNENFGKVVLTLPE